MLILLILEKIRVVYVYKRQIARLRDYYSERWYPIWILQTNNSTRSSSVIKQN